jgi:hypothetical protein
LSDVVEQRHLKRVGRPFGGAKIALERQEQFRLHRLQRQQSSLVRGIPSRTPSIKNEPIALGLFRICGSCGGVETDRSGTTGISMIKPGVAAGAVSAIP